MTGQLIQPKNELLNTNIYVDYESICRLLKREYPGSPVNLDFIRVILDKYRKEQGRNIIDCIVYFNFDTETLPRGQQSVLYQYGIQFRHVDENHDTYGNLTLAADVITTLYKNPKIHKFVIISSGWNTTPLLKQIKSENKSAEAIFTKKDFEPGISEFVEHYEYIEDIIHGSPEVKVADGEPLLNVKEPGQVKTGDTSDEETVELLFYGADAWWCVTQKQLIKFH